MPRLLPLSLMATLLAGTAQAAITAADVWANTQALYARFGLTLEGGLEADAAGQAVIPSATLSYDLPFGWGGFNVILPPMTLVEAGDGSVLIQRPDEQVYEITATIFDPMLINPVEATLRPRLLNENAVMSASGTPGDITYTMSVDRQWISLEDVTFAAEPLPDLQGLDMAIVQDGLTATYRVTEGETLVMTYDTTAAMTLVEVGATSDWGFAWRSVNTVEAARLAGEVRLPASPLDPSNLAQALRDGLVLDVEATSGANLSRTTSGYDKASQTTDVSTTEATQQGLRLDVDGIRTELTTTNNRTTSPGDGMFLPAYEVGLDEFHLALQVPLLSRPKPEGQDLRIAEPGRIGMDLQAEVQVLRDLLSPEAWDENRLFLGDYPVLPLNMTLSDFSATAIGVGLTSAAAFTFDPSRVDPILGIPQPVGGGSALVTGIYAGLDRLLAAGLIDPMMNSAARGALGVYGRATGPDEVTMDFEMTEDGTLLVNGVPLR